MANPELPCLASGSSLHRPNKSSRSRRKPYSSTLFVLLSAISVPPHPAHAQPLDPPQTSLPFLYPPFILQPPVPSPSPVNKRSVSDSTSSSSTPAPSLRCVQGDFGWPDKYIPDEDDGLWYKTEWSAYGSAQCANRQSTCPLPASADSNLDVVVGRTTARDISSSTSTSPNDFDLSTLPTGWDSIVINTASRQLTIAVLVLSVALAVIIIAIMFTCVFRRRKSTPKRDPENKSRRSPNVADDESYRSIREAKAAQRRWSRAASRWRDNIRFAARRRRSNWTLTTSASYTARAQEESPEVPIESQDSDSPPSSRSPTPTPSQRTSLAESIHSPTVQTRLSHELEPELNHNDVPPLNPVVPSQPPAYYAPPSSSSAPVYTCSGCGSSSSSKVPLASNTPPQARDDKGDDYLSSLSGHVATDDKAILSHRVTLASAPPGPVNSHVSQSVSVPSLEDVDRFELPCGSRLSSSSPHIDAHGDEPHPPYSPPTSMLPPPPSKGKQKYDYTRDLDIDVNHDIVTVEPDLGPSAPPFEEYGTAPPFDPDVLVPSAPPMPSEDLQESDDMGGWEDMDDGGEQRNKVELEHVVDGATPGPDLVMTPAPPPTPP